MNQPQLDKYQPGTTLTVGSHSIRIIKYLTSGGFAQIYSCELSKPDDYIHSSFACVKRVVVPDKGSLNVLRAEVEAMKLLRNNSHVVSYIDSHAAKSHYHNGSYEVFLLMEYCEKGGLIDFMNTRLQNRLQEFEVLNIILQITQGVAAMHSLNPPLIHRDLKIENVLISSQNEYKVCDFGSVSGIIRPPSSQQEMAYVEHDILKNTTAQYRSPEMIDLYRNLPVDEKSDIWALGVLLYKLCYYTTPFEKGGETAILYSRYEFPQFPQYSENLKNFIRWMLLVNPIERPNIYQVAERASQLLGVQCPIKDFYAVRNHLPHVASMPQLNIMGQNVNAQNLMQAQHMAVHMAQQHIPIQVSQISQPYVATSDELRSKLTQARTLDNLSSVVAHDVNTSPGYINESVQTLDKNRKLRLSKSVSDNIQAPIVLSPVSTSSSDESSSDEDKILETINLPPRRKTNIAPIYNKMDPIISTSEKRQNEIDLEKKIKKAIESSRKEYEQNKEIMEPSRIEENNSLFGDENEIHVMTENEKIDQVDTNNSPSIANNIKAFNRPPTVPKHVQPKKKIANELNESMIDQNIQLETEDKTAKISEEQKLQNIKTKEMLRQKMRDKLNQSGNKLASKDKPLTKKVEPDVIKQTPKDKSKPIIPPKPERLKPKKPAKPTFLSGNAIVNKV
ncbi:similar to Saccharomyces cerevisiae YIL095W PRK1 Protein serine/threonine kinase [Maudiozyma saulgeensis]|uniref:non-specific serine/threonine protein kinase n=1 Tax=Maudiozyma saulgeensis TaxID=1789683 RepID=A0A1X7R9B9_9SACH|nr:similar to Saccharomyces cerevisiae YIL095W PRK1 Protein serine/threonine kinase [Kazachstania saulgeensis]